MAQPAAPQALTNQAREAMIGQWMNDHGGARMMPPGQAYIDPSALWGAAEAVEPTVGVPAVLTQQGQADVDGCRRLVVAMLELRADDLDSEDRQVMRSAAEWIANTSTGAGTFNWACVALDRDPARSRARLFEGRGFAFLAPRDEVRPLCRPVIERPRPARRWRRAEAARVAIAESAAARLAIRERAAARAG